MWGAVRGDRLRAERRIPLWLPSPPISKEGEDSLLCVSREVERLAREIRDLRERGGVLPGHSEGCWEAPVGLHVGDRPPPQGESRGEGEGKNPTPSVAAPPPPLLSQRLRRAGGAGRGTRRGLLRPPPRRGISPPAGCPPLGSHPRLELNRGRRWSKRGNRGGGEEPPHGVGPPSPH